MWESALLENLFSIGSSKRVLKSQWKNEGVPFYRGREVSRLASKGFVDNELFISEELFFEYATKYGVPNAGDIVITAIGTIGNSYIVKASDRFYFKDASVLWLKKESDVNSEFINYWIMSSLFKAQLDKSNGATVDTLTISKLNTIAVKLPELAEQKRIVALLDEAFTGLDAAIANTEKNLANARELFDSYLNSIFSQQGDGWHKKSLNDVCEISSKLVDPKESHFIDQPHIGAANIISATGELVEVKTAREEGLISGKFIFDETMVLYSKIRPYLMKVARPAFGGLCSADIYPLSCKADTLDRDFLYYLLLSKPFTDYAIIGSARAGMPKVNREHLFQYTFYLPSLNNQREFVDKLNTLSEESNQLCGIYQRKLASLAELKQSLLKKAFTGELTAKAVAEDVAA